jgi:glycerophosphoryl diester phosphodiesterase
VIGHAGSGFTAWWPFNSLPANSLASIQKALKEGAEGIEVDVHMTADRQFILYHDNELDSKTHLKGCPSDYPLEALKGLPYKVDFPFNLFGTHELISLEELIAYFKQLKDFPELHLDLRNHSACNDEVWDLKWEILMIQALDKSIKQWGIPKDKLLLISYSKAMLEEAIRLDIQAKISFEIVGELENGVNWAKQEKIKVLTIKPKLINANIVKQLHEDGFEVITFGAKSRSGNKSLLELNPDVIQTNNVSALHSLLNKN